MVGHPCRRRTDRLGRANPTSTGRKPRDRIVIIAASTGLDRFPVNAVKIVGPFERGPPTARRTRRKRTRLQHHHRSSSDAARPHARQVVDVRPQEVFTSENVVESVDAVVYYEATDPQRSSARRRLLRDHQARSTNLRNLIGDLELDTALTSRDRSTPSCARSSTTPPTSGLRSCTSNPAHRPTAGGGVGDARAAAGRA